MRKWQPLAVKSNEMECGKEENEHVASHYVKLAADVHKSLHGPPVSQDCCVITMYN